MASPILTAMTGEFVASPLALSEPSPKTPRIPTYDCKTFDPALKRDEVVHSHPVTVSSTHNNNGFNEYSTPICI